MVDYWETSEGEKYFMQCSQVFCESFKSETNGYSFLLIMQREERLRGMVTFSYNTFENARDALFILYAQYGLKVFLSGNGHSENLYERYLNKRDEKYTFSTLIYSENVEGYVPLHIDYGVKN